MKNSILLILSTTTIVFGGFAMDTPAPDAQNLITITSKNFEQLAQAEKPLIIDVWAEWCGPCKAVKPVFEETAKNNPEYTFGSLDLQAHQAFVQKQFKITSLPTFLILKENKEYGRIIGATDASSPEALLAKIKECLANEDPTEIGNAPMTPQEFFMQLNQLALKDEADQIKGLKELLEAGLKPDTVLMDLPASKNRPAFKATAISLMLAQNSIALLKVFLEHGATTAQVTSDIDSQISQNQKRIENMNTLKKKVLALKLP